ncbi:hypothetical protein J4218_00215 [Candidatus Pacearchaeota archaeon]|nr:hypothetical protein [Candidatus Pacearchaeota archaeon]
MKLTISLDEDEVKILNKRAKKNMLSLREQVEDILRRSCISGKKNIGSIVNVDDALVNIFSRQKKGRRR